MSVVVAVATYLRPALLDALLPVLTEQARALAVPARVVVVDNDPMAGAREVTASWPGVSYVHEPRPGIAAARNRALTEAGDADAIVFLDDDEVPRPGWLERLVTSWELWGCAAVTGPVVSRHPEPLDEWLRASRAFARPRRDSGTPVASAATNNLLLDLRVLRDLGVRFDDAFGLTGGSDTMLTRELGARGQQIRWCDDAEVEEVVPPERLTREFVLRRHFRTGTTWSRVHLALTRAGAATARRRPELLARGGARLARGTLTWGLARLTGRVPAQARGACDAATGAGVLAGALGLHYVEYARARRSAPRAAATSRSRTTSA